MPLYPAPLVWAQLQGETRSRLNACANASNPDDESWRMAYRSAAMAPFCVLRCGLHSARLHAWGVWEILQLSRSKLLSFSATP